ncbi:ankyrin-1-like [Papaver somniferum]|uniref:ankyrin-1-like n=1 Tax=Papaver somniferum TaxID=3469 RepID=UPI000E701074|nr:ankyrin-1-like [Papaver somniferum]
MKATPIIQGLTLDHVKGEGIGVPEAIKKLVKEGVRGSLHVAASGGSLEVCKYLIENLKLDMDTKDGKGIISPHFFLTVVVADDGVAATDPPPTGGSKDIVSQTPEEKQKAIVKWIDDDFDCKNYILICGTPLHHAVIKGHFDTVRYLLEKGANADASNNRNIAALHFAAKSGDAKIITLLLSKGVRLDIATRYGTALQCAASLGHRDAVKMLLDHGANPNVVSSEDVFKPLISAIIAKSWECVELLLQAGADPNAVTYGNTPLVFAARDGSADVIKRLLEAGAGPNYKMNAGLTALEVAAVKCNYQNVGVLFPVTSHTPTYPDWSIAGLLRDVESDANEMQREVHEKEIFHQAITELQKQKMHSKKSKDPPVLANMSVCFARLGDGNNSLVYATKCVDAMPEWPNAYHRLGVALTIQNRYDDAADAFNKGLTLDPRNKELKDAYMKVMEARLNSMKV